MSESTEPFVEEEIASVAQEIWQDEGNPEGRAEEHWQLAKEHLLCSCAAGGLKTERHST